MGIEEAIGVGEKVRRSRLGAGEGQVALEQAEWSAVEFCMFSIESG